MEERSSLSHEHLMAILDELEADIPRTESWLIAARDAGIPVYVPGWKIPL